MQGQKKKNWKRAGLTCLCLTTVLAAITAYYEYGQSIWYQQEWTKARQQLDEYCKELYIAEKDLKKGTVLTEENTQKTLCYTDQPLDFFVTKEQLGNVVITDIPEGTCLLASMVGQTTQNVKEIFLSDVSLAEHLKSGDRIDVRIRYSNAEDYIVLSDKIMLSCHMGEGMVLQLNEEEILLFSSAIADLQNYENTTLYAVRYPEFSQIESGRVNYIANKEILKMLGEEEYRGGERFALEQRLKCAAYE